MRLLLVLSLLAAACTPPRGDPDPEDLGDRGLDDAHVSTACTAKSDCDDLDPCTDDTCQQDHTCKHTALDCSMLDDECNAGMCDSKSKQCEKVPANESGACTLSFQPGACQMGVCTPTPQCVVSFSSLGCFASNRTRTGTTSGLSNIETYACAANETGPETSFPLRSSTERVITLTLSGLTADLDLILLEGTYCVANATCAAASLNAGTANETITFTAKANADYIVVVDGKNGAKGSFTLTAGCGDCATAAANLPCNMTVTGDTSTSGHTAFKGYQCMAAEPGPEIAYKFNQPIDTQVSLKLKGLSQDLDLLVLGDSSSDCDPTWCRYQSLNGGVVDETVNFTPTPNTNYWVVVDSPGATGGPYQLEVSCPVSCKNTSNFMSCSTPSDTRRNDDSAKSRNLVDNWSCDANTTGPEVVYYVYVPTSGTYTIDLTGLTADLDLIVVGGTFSVCDPATTCIAQSVTAGTADEHVTFAATGGQYYWVAVDGKNGATSPYQIKMRATTCPGPSCYQSANRLSCSYLEDQRRNDDVVRSKNAIDTWACDTGTTGPEVIYQFKPPVSGMYTVTLDGLSADLDLIVVSSTSSVTCDSAAACVAQSVTAGTASESVTFAADAANYYYLAVDGKAGAISPYHIKVASASCPAPICQSGGKSLSCPISSRSVSNTNDTSAATSDITDWPCDTGLSGPEYAHLFTPTGAGPYTFEMIGLAADLDLILMEATATNTCDPAAMCVASTAMGTASEKITNFTADPAKKYWLIVDGKSGAISPYTLAITAGCP